MFLWLYCRLFYIMSNWFCSGGAVLFYIHWEYQVEKRSLEKHTILYTSLILMLNDSNVHFSLVLPIMRPEWPLANIYFLTEYIISHFYSLNCD